MTAYDPNWPTTDKDIPAFNLDFGFKKKLLEGAGWLCFFFFFGFVCNTSKVMLKFGGVYVMNVI